jgi:hypothetical protein
MIRLPLADPANFSSRAPGMACIGARAVSGMRVRFA